MNTVITLYDSADEWYQGTYICCECKEEFMTYREKEIETTLCAIMDKYGDSYKEFLQATHPAAA